MIREVSKIIIVHQLDLEKRYVGDPGQQPLAVKLERRVGGLHSSWHMYSVSDCSAAGTQEHFNLKLFIKNAANRIAYWRKCQGEGSFSKEECTRYRCEYENVIEACDNLSKIAVSHKMVEMDDDQDQVYFSIANLRPSALKRDEKTTTMLYVHRGLQKGVQIPSKAWISVNADDHFIPYEQYQNEQAKAMQELYQQRDTSTQASTD